MGSIGPESFEQVEVTSADQLWSWLAANHDRDDGVWLVTWKKSVSPSRYVSRDEVLDALVAWAWIDGRRMARDDGRTMQLVTPRRASHWSDSYRRRALRLIDEQRMAAPGLASVAAARADGGWTALEDVDALVVPADLAAELARVPGARDGFDALPPSARRFALRWIHLARREDTRARRVEETARRAARGERVTGA